jgi:hypothetical protein
MGIFILVKTIGNLPVFAGSIYSILSSGKLEPGFLVESISIPILYFAVCVMIITKSDSIARRIVSDSDANISLNVDAGIIENVAFCSIGLIALTDAIPDLTQVLTTYILSRPFPYDNIVNSAYNQLAGILARLFIGLFLILRADGLVNLLEKIRLPREIKNS